MDYIYQELLQECRNGNQEACEALYPTKWSAESLTQDRDVEGGP